MSSSLFSNPVFWLSVVTLVAVLGFAGWNKLSVKRRQAYDAGGPKPTGIGGDSDPLA